MLLQLKPNMPIVLTEFYQQLRKIVVCISEMPTTILWITNKKKRNYASANNWIRTRKPNHSDFWTQRRWKNNLVKNSGAIAINATIWNVNPVHERSETFLFDRILTDIGDNQSIENH
jgi:DNA mismatch repair protein MutS2